MQTGDKDRPFEVKQLRPGEAGARKALFDLEADIMEVVWSKGRPLLVREVQEAMERDRTIAYTTVMTTMDRLWKKGLLRRQPEGKAYLYSASLNREEFYRQVAEQVIDSFLPEVSEPVLSFFVEATADSDPAYLDRLEELIRRKRKELGQDKEREG